MLETEPAFPPTAIIQGVSTQKAAVCKIPTAKILKRALYNVVM
jgi:hypothetical protein